MVSRARLLFALFVLVLAACAGEPTQVVLVVDTDMRGPGGIDRVRVEITSPGGTTQSAVATFGAGQPDWPRTLSVVRDDGSLGPYSVRVIGETAGVSRVERRARFSFQEGRSLTVRIDLLSSCVGVMCPAEQTCAANGCRAIDLAPAELVPFDGTITGLDASMPPGDAGPDSGRGDAGDAGPMPCDTDSDCDPLDGACATGVCMLPAGVCAAMPVDDGTACDDGLFCTTGDACTAGTCGGDARDCSAGSSACNVASCDEAADACMLTPVGDGMACDDGMFCTEGETCTGGTCAGGTARDCSDATDCTADSCDEAGDACVNDGAAREGMACDDGLFCTTGDACTAGACGGAARACADALFCNGMETCDEAADACASPAPGCPPDMYTCTTETCAEAGMTCSSMRSEADCTPVQICNPVAYPAPGSGCGAAPSALTVTCPASGMTGTAVSCTARLAAGASGIPGEASRLACTARPRPVTLFTDDFAGGLDARWMTVSGTPGTTTFGPAELASASAAGWEAQVTVPTTGLVTTCVDFNVAQANAGAGERIRWDVAFGAAGAFTTVFDLDFATWEAGSQTYAFNRNVCVAVTGGATTARWRLRMSANMPAIFVDDVVITGLSAPYTIPANGGPDDMATEAGWTFAGGSAPRVGVNGGSSAMFADQESYTATRAAIDASACDVIDADFSFGYQPGAGSLDNGDEIELLASVGGGAFTRIQLVNLENGAWNTDTALLPWLGLRRVTDVVPAAAGASSVVLRFALSVDNPGERVWVDDFVARCVDLRAPSIGAIGDAGGGDYTFDVTSPVPIEAVITCTWQTTNDGPLTGTDTFTFVPL